MSGHFEPVPGGGAAVDLDGVEVSILRSLSVQLLELIGPGDEPDPDADPLAALFAEGPSEPPSDPALRRLFPDAYGDDTEELRSAAADFRRFTENDLRARKREDALTVVRALDGLAAGDPEETALLKLTPDESRAWLGTLNDLRLTIATRLEITEDEESERLYRLPDSDPRKPMVMAYLWLGALQESLVETLLP
ncbi:DUF2017 domain-containing protein [Streptomyces termitum]|uniref:DUF2017 domain-containing protein n=1 Tax=Streptomyces termitum TaxID=67368 RepID=A0A918W6E6_9ACTN|nr:DUF2017 domain-containing protein [Streptomyces termitum]GHA70829.1 hypothetical protein GCM10010305_11640 [Streptomyces termitum]